MSGLAKILLEAGYEVSGSDLSTNRQTQYLSENGAQIHKGHHSDNVEGCSVVVKSTAIRDTNPEITRAAEKNIPIIHRAQLLSQLLYPVSIGITGTHGKTTTTGMITTIFHKLGFNPGFAIGGEIPELKTNAAFGKGGYFIAELDESDGTIELFSPDIGIITNLEFEHPDHYSGGFEQLMTVFERFIENLDKNTKIIINIDDPGNLQLMGRVSRNNFITYSILSQNADYHACVVQTAPVAKMNFYRKTEFLGEVTLGIPGEHNISNATAAVAAAMECISDFDRIKQAISQFKGMKKRFQVLGYINGAQIIDDYAHHPTEIRATLKTAQSLNKNRVIAVFQPHRYTRLASLWDDFLNCFNEADILFICDVFPASEDPIEGINSENFHRQVSHRDARHVKGELDRVADAVSAEIKPDDMVITMGAGTITEVGPMIIKKTGK